MAIILGSARHDERGKYSGGAAGDSLQKSSTNDTTGEVSMQNFYVHSKGWYVLRPKQVAIADALANNMKTACNNANIGYDQNQRLGIIANGINSTKKTEADCSTTVRACCIAAGFDPGNFTTADEVKKLEATGMFETHFAYVSQLKTPLYNGDVIVTKTKGHTCIVVSGNPRQQVVTTKTDTVEKVSGDSLLAIGFQHAKNFTGVADTNAKKARARVLQHAINLDYHKNIAEDAVWGSASTAALSNHYIKKGERQYLVTAAEIIMYLLGKDPKGVESPGTFGTGLEKACGASKITASMFLSYVK